MPLGKSNQSPCLYSVCIVGVTFVFPYNNTVVLIMLVKRIIVRLLARKTNCLDNKETLSIATAVGIVHYMKLVIVVYML